MPLSPSNGNMYPWCDYTINPLKGQCDHKCTYCFTETKMKPRYFLIRVKYSGPPELDEKELRTNLSKAMLKLYRIEDLPFVPKNVPIIFPCSLNDICAKDVKDKDIVRIMEWTNKEPRPFYVFQSKNPSRFVDFEGHFPPNTILGTTIETNRDTSQISEAPNTVQRASGLAKVNCNYRMLTIEPIMGFDLDGLLELVKMGNPNFVSVGANTSSVKLPEPSSVDIHELLTELRKMTHVILKRNLSRLYSDVSIQLKLTDTVSEGLILEYQGAR